ncbi:MAG TPA: HAMP domain-containing sensor histidine kinase [Elusimicrobiota bacterium]|nr:HAMP domain-containing sensor histidine kinase [Elusimicrobiota bacterium]
MRLNHRFALIFSVFGLAIAAAFQIIQFRDVHRASYASARGMADVTTSAVAALVSDEAREGRLSPLSIHLQSIVREAGLASIVAFDSRGRRILGRYDSAASLRRKLHPGVSMEDSYDGIYDLEKSEYLGRYGYGQICVSYHIEALRERMEKMDAQSIRFGVMSFIAIALLAWLLGTWLGLRLDRLVPRLEHLPDDPENFRPIKVSGKDEFSRVAAAFNRLGSRLKEETRRRLDLEDERSDLMAMLVHDLKTPLTVISSGIALLEESTAQANKRTFQLLRLSVGRLRRMVEDILQLNRLEAVDESLEISPVDLASLIRSCAKDFEIIAEEKKHEIALDLPEKSPSAVMGDSVLLRRVLDNLLYNAIEHTPPDGKIIIALTEEKNAITVSVSDSGPGIPLEARADIFRKFFSKEMKRHVGNVGLGLALCEKVVLRHGGIIAISDAAPHGAKFYFTLPASKAA